MTAYSSIESSVEAIKEGAFYFITKPVQTSQLLLLLEKAARQLDMRRTIDSLEDVIRKEIIGNSPQMKQVLRLVDQVKDTKAGVLITGESGTGKELIAQQAAFFKQSA
jgi:two-component system response regulator AtoC